MNNAVHKPAKQFIKLNMFNKSNHIVKKLKMDHCIEAIHTRKKYGYTYIFQIGRISMFGFVKVKVKMLTLHQLIFKFTTLVYVTIFKFAYVYLSESIRKHVIKIFVVV